MTIELPLPQVLFLAGLLGFVLGVAFTLALVNISRGN